MAELKKSDKNLVEKILEGDSQLFTIIISNTQNLVISIIYKMIKNPEDRKDILQEVYLKVYDKLSSFNFNSKLSTWIGTITYNTCINFLAKKKISILIVADDNEKTSWERIESKITINTENQTESFLFKKERSHILTTEIEKLPALFKTIITLYHKEELSYKEIATITGLPEGTLKSYLFRARKQLKDDLLKNYNKEDL